MTKNFEYLTDAIFQALQTNDIDIVKKLAQTLRDEALSAAKAAESLNMPHEELRALYQRISYICSLAGDEENALLFRRLSHEEYNH